MLNRKHDGHSLSLFKCVYIILYRCNAFGQMWFLFADIIRLHGKTNKSACSQTSKAFQDHKIIPEEMRAHLHERQGGVELDMKEWILDSIRHTMHDKALICSVRGTSSCACHNVSRVFLCRLGVSNHRSTPLMTLCGRGPKARRQDC